MKQKNLKKGILPYLLLLIFMVGIYYFFNLLNQKTNILTYDQFINEMNNDQIEEIVITPSVSASVYEVVGRLKDYEENEIFTVRLPLSETVINKIINNEEKQAFEI